MSLNVNSSAVATHESYLKKWRYCQAKHNDPAPFVELAQTQSSSIYLAGDAFSSSKIEGAFESGRKAALSIVEKMNV